MESSARIGRYMTCRHSDPINNPGCSSYKSPDEQLANLKKKFNITETPDASNFEVARVEKVGNHLVMEVIYPNCNKCSYEGHKIMVFLDVDLKDAITWRTIDPHFRDPNSKRTKKEAPSPAARFPANETGWADAIDYAVSR